MAGHPEDEEAALPADPLGDRYRLGPLLGQGTYSSVYEATDLQLKRQVAVKVLTGLQGESSREARRRFQHEARLSAQLRDERVVPIYDFGIDGDTCYLVQELVRGQNLREWLQVNQPDTRAALNLGRELCDAVRAVHAAGMVHRDLKPENVLIDERQRLRLTDFGLAREILVTELTASLPTLPNSLLGTPRYMAPEQFAGQPVSPATDVFALCAILYELFVHEMAFPGETLVEVFHQTQYQLPAALRGGDPRLPTAIAEVLRRGLEPDPGRRIHSAEELRHELDQAAMMMDAGPPWRIRLLAIPELNPGAPVSRVARAFLLALCVLALLRLGLVTVNQFIAPDIGFVTINQGQVYRVERDSEAWQDGIRPGMTVERILTANMLITRAAMEDMAERLYPGEYAQVTVDQMGAAPVILPIQWMQQSQEGRAYEHFGTIIASLALLAGGTLLLWLDNDRGSVRFATLIAGLGALLALSFPEGVLGPYVALLDNGMGELLFLLPGLLGILGAICLVRYPLCLRSDAAPARYRWMVLGLTVVIGAGTVVPVVRDFIMALELAYRWPHLIWLGALPALALFALPNLTGIGPRKPRQWLMGAYACFAVYTLFVTFEVWISLDIRALLQAVAYTAVLSLPLLLWFHWRTARRTV